MELQDVLQKRRSYRAYENRLVSHDLLIELVRVATQAPVSCNLQITQFVIIDDQALLDRLGKEVSYKFRYAPTAIIVLIDSRFAVERLSAVTGAGMAIENLLLRATELGLGTCAMAGFDRDEVVKRILNIPDHLEIVLLIGVGYPDKTFGIEKISKIALADTYRFNSYNGLKTMNASAKLKAHTVASLIDYRRRIAPVYLNRFRLNTLNDKYYQKTVVFAKNHITLSGGSWLDLLSYDGAFLKASYEAGLGNKFSFTTTDYLEPNLKFFNKNFGCNYLTVNINNKIDGEEKFDVISFVFQLEVTADVERLIKNAVLRLNPDGYFLVATTRDSFFRRLFLLGRRLTRRLQGKRNNVYEGNPFYKIGPRRTVKMRKIKYLFESRGLKLVVSEVISGYESGRRAHFLLFKKIPLINSLN